MSDRDAACPPRDARADRAPGVRRSLPGRSPPPPRPPRSSADAAPLDPIGGIGGVVGAGVDAVTGGVGERGRRRRSAAILKALFAWPAKLITRELLAWLVAVPDYAIDPEHRTAPARHGSNLAELGATTTSTMAFAALAAVGTVSAIRYWAAGLSGSGGLEALEGLWTDGRRGLLIVLWPWLFRHCAGAGERGRAAACWAAAACSTTPRGCSPAPSGPPSRFNFFAIVIAMRRRRLLFLALLVSKIAVSAATALVFVGMPLAVMLWRCPSWRGSRARPCAPSPTCSSSRWRGRCALPRSPPSASTRSRSRARAGSWTRW